jgi:hypothetical protein
MTAAVGADADFSKGLFSMKPGGSTWPIVSNNGFASKYKSIKWSSVRGSSAAS